jgi:2'-5' RNA ligase
MMNSRYFLALLPPPEMQDYANQVRQQFADRYASKKAFNSPPHITIQPSFEWPTAAIESLVTHLTTWAHGYGAVPVCLSGFGAFAPRVIFINVCRTPDLLTLQANLSTDCLNELKIMPQMSDWEFAPHMTVAFRDLTPENFQRAWPHFKQQQLGLSNAENGQYHFVADRLTLLKHDGRRWQIDREIPLQPMAAAALS